jgi:predicted RNase H-like nuclease (RuvC/YqgF family)
VINKLEKQLNDEKNEREKLRKEMEELRKMNEKLQ